MRQGQQNRRMRGRNNNGGSGSNNTSGNSNNNNNNNRRGPNPLTRSYESNGPDVKVRGTAQNIAEKYLTLARDAQSSGDRVMAENYLQHAEHYNRIIAAALAQQQQFQRETRDEDEDEGPGENIDSRFDDVKHAHPVQQEEQPEVRAPFDGNSPQPVIETAAASDVAAETVLEPRENPRPPRENARPRRERTPRPPREPRVAAVVDNDAPAEDGLLATLSRGADKPIPVTADE
jgi:Domain of unknown function (DUF4167)